MRPAVYATREQVKTALDSAETARNNRRIDRHIREASDEIERLTLRKFYPWTGIRTLDWLPEDDTPKTWRLWLGENELVSLTSVTAAGTLVSGVLARPDTGPPFDHLEVDRSGTSVWASGATPQRSIAVTGVFGYQLDEVTGPDLAAAVSSTTATTIQVTASAEVGVGSLLRVNGERMNVTGRSMITTGQTLQLTMDDSLATTTVRVTTGSAFVEDEVILLDSEKMRIDEIAGNNLIVTRAWDGTAPASHNGSTIYAARTLTVERGACGTTAATHSSGDDVLVWRPPELITKLCVAEALVTLAQETSGYARMVGSGDNERESAGRALEQLRKRVKTGYYRVRKGVV